MKFWEAMREMQENGKKVRCKDWSCRAYVGDDSISGFSWTYLEQDWELYKEREKFYSWSEVVRGLKEGKRFKRKGWDKNCIVSINGFIRLYLDSGYMENWHQLLEDFEAHDWVECK